MLQITEYDNIIVRSPIIIIMSKARKINISDPPSHSLKKGRIMNRKEEVKLSKEDSKKKEQRSQIIQYFDKVMEQTPLTLIEAEKEIIATSLKDIDSKIRKGKLKLKRTPEDFSKIIEKQASNELTQLTKKHEQMIHIFKILEYQRRSKSTIRNNALSDSDSAPQILTKEDHQMLIKKMQSARQVHQKRHKQMIEEMNQKIAKQEERQKKQQETKLIQQRQNKRKMIIQNIEKKKKQGEKKKQTEKALYLQSQNLKQRKLTSQKMNQRYQSEVVIPALEQKKRRLKEIRQFHQAFNLDAIRLHEKEYRQRKNKSVQFQSKVKNQIFYHPPKKTEKMNNFIENEKIENKRKLEEKRLKVDQQKQKREEYSRYIREQFSPKINKNKQEQLEKRVQKLKKSKIKQRKVQDQRAIGDGYLLWAKKMIKNKKTQSQKLNLLEDKQYNKKLLERQTIKKSRSTSLERRSMQKIRRKRVQSLLNSSGDKQVKIKQLEFESNKLKEALQRKQELMRVKNKDVALQHDLMEMLISGLQTKIGILKVYNKSEGNQEEIQEQRLNNNYDDLSDDSTDRDY